MKIKKIIKLLGEGADADIWYDAGMYQDKRTAKQIAKTQKAMRVASNVLLNLQMAATMRHGAMPIPLVGPKEPRPGKSDVIRMGDEGEGSSPETMLALNKLLQKPLSQEAETKICDALEIRCPQPHLCTEGCAVVAWKKPEPDFDPRPFGATEEEVGEALDRLAGKPAPEPEGGPYVSPMEEAMTEYWGARCADFAEGCPCCDAWAAYDRAMSAQQRIDAALVHMAQPDYGDTRTALDYYAEGVNLLKGYGLYD